MHTIKQPVVTAVIACGTFAVALPAAADPIDWASWSNVVPDGTAGSATATFTVAGITANQGGELQQFVANYPTYNPGRHV